MGDAPDVEQLLEGVRNGDTGAFESLVRSLTEPLYQYAASIVRDPGAAEEAVQSTFIRVFERRRTLDASLSLRGYCYRIVTNLARNHMRDRRLRQEREVEALNMREHTAPDPQLAATAREAWQMVDHLPDELATTLRLRFGHGLTLAEVAQVLEIPEGTVSTRQRNGLKDLRERLALTAPFTLGLENLDSLLHAGQPPSVPASPGLLTRTETLVMASVGTKSAVNLTILAVVAALLLCGGIVIAAVTWESSTTTTPATTTVSEASGESRQPMASQLRDTPGGSTAEVTANPDVPPATASPSDSPAPAGKSYSATVRGKVVDSSNQGIAGATVTALPLNALELALRDLVSPAHQPAEGTTRTDAGGSFELVLTGRNGETADRTYFALAPEAPGMIGLRAGAYWVVPGESLDGVELKLFRGGRVEGLVVSESDPARSVPDVPVRLSRWPIGNGDTGDLIKEVTGVSNKDGAFAFENLPPGSYSAWVHTPPGETYFSGARYDASMELAEGGTVTGLLLPYADSQLTFRTEPAVEAVSISVATKSGSSLLRFSHHVTTREAGHFRIRGIPGDATGVTITTDGFAAHVATFTAARLIELGTIQLVRRSLTGRVIDQSGAGIADARLELCGAGGYMLSSATSAADGSFAIGFDAGDWRLVARHSGFAQSETTLTLTAGVEPAPVTLTLLPGGSIAGSVTIGGAEPTPQQLGATADTYVTVSAALTDGRDPETIETWDVTRNAGPAGAFRLPDLAPGRYVLRATFGDCVAFAAPIAVVAGATSEARLDIPLGGTITGRVIGRDGKPLNTSVYLTTEGALDMFWKWDARTARPDAHGRYRFDFVNPGAYYVRLDTDPELMGAEQLAARAVKVSEGETAELTIDLSKVTGPVIRGRVTVNGVSRFRDAVLVTPDAAFSLRTATIDDQGNFELSGMKPGSYYLWLADSKWSPKLFYRLTVKVDGDDVIEINRDFAGGRLTGRVLVAEAGADYDYTKVKIQVGTNGADDVGMDSVRDLAGFSAKCNASGEFTIETLVEGPYRLIAVAPGKPSVERIIDMAGDAQLDFVVGGRAGGLKVEVARMAGTETAGPLPESGLLADGAVVSVFNAEGKQIALTDQQRYLALTAGDSVSVDSLVPGTYQVRIRGLYVESCTASLDVREGETAEWKPVLQRAAVLKLRVMNAELGLAEVRAARVVVYDSDGRVVEDAASPLDYGSAEATEKLIVVTSLKAGAYRIVVKLDSYLDVELDVQVEQSRNSEREITFKK